MKLKFSILKFQISKFCETSQILMKTKCSNVRSQTHGNTRSEVFLVCSNFFFRTGFTFLNISDNTAKHELSVITDFAVCQPLLPTDKQFVIHCYRLISSAIPCYRLIHYPRQSGLRGNRHVDEHEKISVAEQSTRNDHGTVLFADAPNESCLKSPVLYHRWRHCPRMSVQSLVDDLKF